MKTTRTILKLLVPNSKYQENSTQPSKDQKDIRCEGSFPELKAFRASLENSPIKSPAIAERLALLLYANILRQSKRAIFAQANQSKEIILELLR